MLADLFRRILDVVVAITGLLLLSPLILIAAMAVKISGPGPIIFKQTRIGWRGRPFVLFKFRSMYQSMGGSRVTSSSDTRITALGRFLRGWKIDEIPQLVNVLRGEMSLVGPRPEIPEFVELYPEAVRVQVLSVKPGLTDPATLVFRNEEEILAKYPDPQQAYREVVLPEKLKMYTRYVESRSLLGDILLLLKTAVAIVRR